VGLELQEQALGLKEARGFLQRLQNMPFGFGFGVAARVQQTSQLVMYFGGIRRVQQEQSAIG
jgi:hypothetical protein